MTRFYFNSKNPIFGPFSQFLVQKQFSKKPGFVTHNFIRVSNTMTKLEKNIDLIPRKHPDKQDGRTDRPYFIGHFWLLPGVQQVQLQ